MAGLTARQKKDWAKMLYLKENLTQAEIAEKVSVSRITINKWINAEKWEEHKAGITITREEQLKNLYRQLGEINKVILTREDKARYAYPDEANTIRKLADAIRKMETDTGIADIISVGHRFIEFSRKICELDKVKELVLLYDAFQKDSIK